ncbi:MULTISPECIES: hypothetical protein [unclassified Clostridium]|uniref:hypothetical protein n=1 Tax=unclassified Clostridium TaxID=2614128 RepID=UPI00023B000C|nr:MULTISPECIES: hypothetical protein [unclassified Clostridium]EHI98546.1 hypothetical protein CDLVIII_1859 [Clostridium sp. DL-VIII]OOM77823.1 hypothetical protein CLOBL_27860 [Clostridium sp. BL-8]
MINQRILKYVDDVMLQIDADDVDKIKIENDLIRRISRSDEYRDVNAVIEKFGTPRELALEIIAKYEDDYEVSEKNDRTSSVKEHGKHRHHHHRPQGPYGEYMYEENETNIKLLYIPLIQISSGTERIRLPIADCYYEYEE